VVASSIPTLREIFDDETGILVPPRDVEQLAEALGRVLDDEELARALGEGGRERFLTRLTAEQSHRRMIELYHKLAGS
jgi:glycosyltransferase involved in cell wall biosynthesis